MNFEDIFEFIKNYCGINLNEAHREFMTCFIEERLAVLNLDSIQYLNELKINSEELTLLIDEAAINETYFFREELQFKFLKEKYLPQFCGKEIKIWSAACSSGEESLSLYTLCESCLALPVVYATDIDTKALSKLRKGIYSEKSFRTDGLNFKSLIEKNAQLIDGKYYVNPEVKDKIISSKYNHFKGGILPFANESLDLIFMRNIFIYFDPDFQIQLLNKLAQFLKKDGLLFVSVNEIASINCDGSIPFKKEFDGDVFYLKKI